MITPKFKIWLKSATIRAVRTIAQNLVSTLPVGLVITPVMIEKADWQMLYVILAWLSTGLLAGLASFLTSVATGLPEADAEYEARKLEESRKMNGQN